MFYVERNEHFPAVMCAFWDIFLVFIDGMNVTMIINMHLV